MPENAPAPSHAWNSGSLDNASGLTKVDAHASSLSSEAGGQGGVHSSIMTVEEAESVIERLCSTPVTEIGSSSFLRRHADFERLNLQAHQQAQQKTDEFVLVRRGREGVSLRSFVVVSAFSIIYNSFGGCLRRLFSAVAVVAAFAAVTADSSCSRLLYVAHVSLFLLCTPSSCRKRSSRLTRLES